MWSALGKVTGAVTGVFYTTEQPPFDCAWPLKDVGDMRNCGQMADDHYQQVQQLHNDPQWTLIESYEDPDGGDMKLFTRPQWGNYHCLKATFTIQNCTAEKFINVVGSSNLQVRQKFSADCIGLKKLDEPTPMTEILHCNYWAPPPVAGRDFCFLVSRRENGDGTWDLWGCSVNSDLAPDVSGMTSVRGVSIWGWKLIQAGDNLLVQYSNCFDPRGWTPGFLLSWLKTAAAKEFCAIRNVMLGKDVKTEHIDFSAVGMSQDQVNAAVKEHETEKK